MYRSTWLSSGVTWYTLQGSFLAISVAQVSRALTLTSTSSTWQWKLIGIQVHLGRRDERPAPPVDEEDTMFLEDGKRV